MKRRLSGTNLSSENNLPTFQLNTPVVIRAKVTTGAFSRNVGKLFSKLKLVPDNLLFILGETLLNLSIILHMSHTLSSLFLSSAQLLCMDVLLAPERAVSSVGWWLPVVGLHWISLPTNFLAYSTGRAHTHTPGSHGASSVTCHESNAPESHSTLLTPNR